jgi:hypothetical protein
MFQYIRPDELPAVCVVQNTSTHMAAVTQTLPSAPEGVSKTCLETRNRQRTTGRWKLEQQLHTHVTQYAISCRQYPVRSTQTADSLQARGECLFECSGEE